MKSIPSRVSRLPRRAAKACRSVVHNPRVPIAGADGLTRLGTDYGGWVFQDDPQLRGSTIISAGLGEDASFDVEFAARYGARVLMVDPTPRAIDHFGRVMERLGRKAEKPYTTNGQIPPEAYDLSTIEPGQLRLIERALTDTAGPIQFFAPPNPAHVSYSVINFQNNYASDTPHIMVDSVTIDDLWELAGGDVPLVKFDIEGAEVEAILDMLRKQLIPRQVLVEFDELNFPSRRASQRFREVHSELLAHGFRVAEREGRANFLYLRN